MQPEYNMENNELQKKPNKVVWIGETLFLSDQMNEQERVWQEDPMQVRMCVPFTISD